MTQTQPNKSGPSVGTAAAQAAAGHTTAKPADAKPAETKPVDTAAGAATAGTASGTPERKKRESKKRVFIVVGQIHEFESIVQAEKFLNSPEAPAGEYAVLQGNRTRTSKRVSLR